MPGNGYTSDLTDQEWALLEPLLPGPRPTGRKRIHSQRVLVNAMLYVLQTGCAWRLLDPRKTFHVLPRRWVVERTFAWLGKCRRLSKDYEALPKTTENLVYLAMVRLMLRRLGRDPPLDTAM
ncbi:transposase [Deinococcus kurensis]|uniref:transposase n=1 Tax=Deinococcus kurensis TaxID=2662757 RepID=UPI0012D2EC69|nr:transposase [Deinococcus kurensis]